MRRRLTHYTEGLGETVDQFAKGAFLVLKADDTINVMTIGWCLVGTLWNLPVFQALIRTSRYSYQLMQKTDAFTVSVPARQSMKEALLYCGTHSGRDRDKFAVCHLTAEPGIKVSTPVIGGCARYYECKILTRQRLPMENAPGDESHEPEDGHYHVMVYGEIVACY